MSQFPPPPVPGNDPWANPYAVTSNPTLNVVSDAESIRKAHIKHEASVQSIGTLYLLGGSLGLLLAIGYAIGVGVALTASTPTPATVFIGLTIMSLLVGSLAILQLVAARGLWKLQQWARIVAIALSAIGLIGFPLGTLICGYFLYLLLSAKANVIFSDEYQAIIAQTPHIKYRTSLIVWILVGVLAVVLLAILFVVLLGT